MNIQENAYCERLNGILRNELLDGEIFYTITEVKVLREYSTIRPHRSLGLKAPAPEVKILPFKLDQKLGA